MRILTAVHSAQPDYIALAMVLAMAVIVAVLVIRKKTGANKKTLPEVPAVQEPAQPAPAAPGSAGKLKLHNVEPKTAAMLMAIVANKLNKPLNELRFISIKEVNE